MSVMDEVRRWQPESGPERWMGSWRRTLELVDPLFTGQDHFGSDSPEAEAAASLATALYLLAEERDVSPQEITRQQVEQFVEHTAESMIEGYPTDLPTRWSARLTELGHDLEAEDDPVAVCWRKLRIDYPEPPASFIDSGDASLHRVGSAVGLGISTILAPIYSLQF